MSDEARLSLEVRAQWRRLGRNLLLGFVTLGVVFAGLVLYLQTWPILFVVSSPSMQHGNDTSAVGVMDVGDIVLVQQVASPGDLVSYVRGRTMGYTTYGDYGDVAVIRDLEEVPAARYVLHRPLAYVVWNVTACSVCYDIPELGLLDDSEWDGWNVTGNMTGVETNEPYGLVRFVLRGAGWKRDLTIDFEMWTMKLRISGAGILTLGDNNLYLFPEGWDLWVVPYSELVGKAVGELPWLGLVSLTLAPEPSRCCEFWGSTHPDRGAPATSWRSLELTLVGLLVAVATSLAVTWHMDRRRGLIKKTNTAARVP